MDEGLAVAGEVVQGASSPGVRASIVIVNRNDRRVAETMTALRQVVSNDVEIVCVDASGGALDDLAEEFDFVRWIPFEDPARRPRTIAAQRNVGIRESRGDAVVFLDASCEPEKGWLEHLIDPLVHGDEEIVAGRVEASSAGSIHEVSGRQGGSDPAYLPECSAMNLAVARSVFDRLGGFDEELGYAEDVDFAWRANDAGTRILYVPEAVVRHDWGHSSEDLPRAFRYGVARVRLYRKHPRRWRQLLGTDRYIALYGAYLIALVLSPLLPEVLLALPYLAWRHRGDRPVYGVLYQLTYAAGAWSELLHLRVTRGQRR